MLEFAIGSGVLLAAFTATFQFGFTFLQYNNLGFLAGLDGGSLYIF